MENIHGGGDTCPSALVIAEGETDSHFMWTIIGAIDRNSRFASRIPASHLYSLGPVSLETDA